MPAHRLKSAVHPGGALVPPPGDAIEPIVRLTSFVNGAQKATGSGFWIDRWETALLTARHVVEGATAVRITARAQGGVVSFDAATVAHRRDADLAVLCALRAPNVPRRLRLGVPGSSHRAVFSGYPWNVHPSSSPPRDVEAQAELDGPLLRLSREGQSAMSGGPVLSRDPDTMDLVFGVYLGPVSPGGPSAFATDEALFNELMFAAVELRNQMLVPA